MAATAYPRQQRPGDYGGNVYVSGRGGMGMFVAKKLRGAGHQARIEDRERVIRDLFDALRVAGLVALVDEPKQAGEAGGYQLKASGIRWIGHPAEAPARLQRPDPRARIHRRRGIARIRSSPGSTPRPPQAT